MPDPSNDDGIGHRRRRAPVIFWALLVWLCFCLSGCLATSIFTIFGGREGRDPLCFSRPFFTDGRTRCWRLLLVLSLVCFRTKQKRQERYGTQKSLWAEKARFWFFFTKKRRKERWRWGGRACSFCFSLLSDSGARYMGGWMFCRHFFGRHSSSLRYYTQPSSFLLLITRHLLCFLVCFFCFFASEFLFCCYLFAGDGRLITDEREGGSSLLERFERGTLYILCNLESWVVSFFRGGWG